MSNNGAMNINKSEILNKICYTELVYGRINKKLGTQFSKSEIEKIGLILSAIRQKIFGGKDNLSIIFERQIEVAKGVLLNE